MEPKRNPRVPAQWTHEAAHEGRAHRHSKRKTVCSLTQFLVERKESHLSGALFLRVTRSLCILHYSMYFTMASLTSLTSFYIFLFKKESAFCLCILHLVRYAYLPGTLHAQYSYPHSFLFVAVCAKSPHSTQATGRALCAQNGART